MPELERVYRLEEGGWGWATGLKPDTVPMTILFVSGSAGDLSGGQPFRTFGAAMAHAESLAPSESNRVVIYCLDANSYEEAIVGVPYVDIDARHATLVPTYDATLDSTVGLICADYSSYTFYAVSGGSGTDDSNRVSGVGKSSGSGPSYVRVNEVTLGDWAIGFVNFAANSQLLVECRRVLVGASSFCVGAGSTLSGFGHMHFDGGDIYLAGNDAIGIVAVDAGSIVTRFDHILEAGGPYTGTVGIYVNTTTGYVSAVGTQIRAVSAATFAAGQLNVVCPFIDGTLDGVPAAGCTFISNTLVYLPDAPATFQSVTP